MTYISFSSNALVFLKSPPCGYLTFPVEERLKPPPNTGPFSFLFCKFLFSTSSDDVAFTLIGEFNNIAEFGLKFLLKVILLDAKPKFADFEKLWNSQSDAATVVGSMIPAITNQIQVMQKVIEPFFYGKLVTGTIDVCGGKYLKFLKTKSENGSSSKLTKVQMARIQSDIVQWTTFFRSLANDLDLPTVNIKIHQLEDFKNLLILDYSSPQYLEVVHKIARRYCGEGRVAITRLFTATVNLRTDGNFRLQQAIDGIMDKFKSSQGANDIDPIEDMFVRIFGDKSNDKKKGFTFFKRSEANKPDVNKDKDIQPSTALGAEEEYQEPDRFEDDDDTASTVYGDDASEFGDSHAIEISDLRVRGLQTSSLISSANPYIKAVINKERFKTNVKWNSKNAEWTDFRMNFNVIASNLSSKSVIVLVYDKERVRRKKLMGTLKIPLTGIDRGPIQGWFTLEKTLPAGISSVQPAPTKSLPLDKDNAPCGQIHMRIELLQKRG